MLLAAASSALADRNVFATLFVVVAILALVVGLRRKGTLPTFMSGWLIYLPLGVALSGYFPPFWSYLGSGLFATAVPEKLSFEYDASAVLGSPTGVDAEVRSRLSALSSAHRNRMLKYAALSVGLMGVAAVVSGATSYASELIAATALLILLTALYATR
jgi:hypothetical protein